MFKGEPNKKKKVRMLQLYFRSIRQDQMNRVDYENLRTSLLAFSNKELFQAMQFKNVFFRNE